MELAEETVASYRSTEEQVRSRYLGGLRSSLDLRLATTSVANAEALLEVRRSQYDRAIRQLEILLGRYPAARLAAGDDLLPVPPPVPAGLPAELLARRPDLVAAEHQLAAADFRVAQAQRALYPRLSLTGSGGTASEELRDLTDWDFRVWSLAVSLLQPIFQGGRLRAGVDLAEARSQEALERYAGALLRAFSEVESALASEGHLSGQLAALRLARGEAREAQRLAEERYRTGLEGFVTVLEAQRRALVAESELLRVRRLSLDARVDLHLSLGGGFEEPTHPGEEGSS
jgi:NodT family efflux transporter outer membrane factor (OMF) lipoprotein